MHAYADPKASHLAAALDAYEAARRAGQTDAAAREDAQQAAQARGASATQAQRAADAAARAYAQIHR